MNVRALFIRVVPGSQGMEEAVARALQGLELGLPLIRVQWPGAALDPQIREASQKRCVTR